MYLSSVIANTFVYLADKRKKKLNSIELNNLVYFAHCWWLVIDDKPLIVDDIEAWSKGPVIPLLYYSYKHCKMDPIELNNDTWIVTDKTVLYFLSEILTRILDISVNNLISMITSPGTPYHTVKHVLSSGLVNCPIPNDIIKKYHQELIKDINLDKYYQESNTVKNDVTKPKKKAIYVVTVIEDGYDFVDPYIVYVGTNEQDAKDAGLKEHKMIDGTYRVEIKSYNDGEGYKNAKLIYYIPKKQQTTQGLLKGKFND